MLYKMIKGSKEKLTLVLAKTLIHIEAPSPRRQINWKRDNQQRPSSRYLLFLYRAMEVTPAAATLHQHQARTHQHTNNKGMFPNFSYLNRSVGDHN
jgi:hypothetical protein